MRYQALLLLLAVGSANAATLEVAVSQGTEKPMLYTYQLTGERQTLDLRDSDRYTVAIHDSARKKDICRDAEYRTGMVMNLRDVEKPENGKYKIEIVGQVSHLKSITVQGTLDCGSNMVPVIENTAFSDTSVITVGQQKAMVVDGKTTLLLNIKE